MFNKQSNLSGHGEAGASVAAAAAISANAASAAPQSGQPMLAMAGIVKSYPGVRALSQVALRLFPGEIHVLMGQNGAGKSTLIKVLTGVEQANAGSIHLNGQAIRPGSVQQA